MDATRLAQVARELGSRYLSEYVRNVKRFAGLVEGMRASGPQRLTASALSERYAALLRDAPALLTQLAEAGLSYYELVLKSGIEASNRFFDPQQAAAASAATQKSAPALLFRGQRGERSGNAFVVTNHKQENIEVAFALTDIVSDDGSLRIQADASFTPASCTLAPRSEQVVQCALRLPEALEPGTLYRAQLRVVGFPDMTMPVSVQVDAPAAPTPEAPRKPRARRSRRKSTS